MDNEKDRKIKQISVADFLQGAPEELSLEPLTDQGHFDSVFIDSFRIQKLGLALAGFSNYLHAGRVKMVGQSEVEFLLQLSPEERRASFDRLDPGSITCIVLVRTAETPAELIEFAESNSIPLIQSPLLSSRAISLITGYLEESLAPQTSVHGVLLEMYGIGVLMIGDSGIGKSECALDLIARGHSLVADDAVMIKRIGDRLDGSSPELTFEHLEIRGLGIVNVRELFGVVSICGSIAVKLCIELRRWSEIDNIERIGLEMRSHDICGVEIAKFVFPVSSGRNISTLIETAVKLYLLRCNGIDPAARLIEKHQALVGGQGHA